MSVLVLPVAGLAECRLGHVMIDPQNGMNGFTAWSVIDHHEREEPRVRAVTETTSVNP